MTRCRLWLTEAMALLREGRTPTDSIRLMRVRMALSKLGPVVCRTHFEAVVDTKTLGPSVHLRTNSTDVATMLELIAWHSYTTLLAHLRQPPALIVDLGANIGLVSRWLLEKFPHARLVAVEPEPNNAAVLRRNLSPYGDRACVIQACVSGRPRKVKLKGGHGDWGFIMQDAGDGDIEALTLTQLLDRAGIDRATSIDLLKCDIEGAEREVFQDCGEWIGRVSMAIIECHAEIVGDDICRWASEGGQCFNLVERTPNDDYGFETVIMEACEGLHRTGERPGCVGCRRADPHSGSVSA